jgi:hypothetical protein
MRAPYLHYLGIPLQATSYLLSSNGVIAAVLEDERASQRPDPDALKSTGSFRSASHSKHPVCCRLE